MLEAEEGDIQKEKEYRKKRRGGREEALTHCFPLASTVHTIPGQAIVNSADQKNKTELPAMNHPNHKTSNNLCVK